MADFLIEIKATIQEIEEEKKASEATQAQITQMRSRYGKR